MNPETLADIEESIAECCGRGGRNFCESFGCATVRPLLAYIRDLERQVADALERLPVDDVVAWAALDKGAQG